MSHICVCVFLTLQMGIQHFSGLFVLLCMGVGGALLTLAGEHTFYHLVIPRLRRANTLQYWLHTSQKIHRAINTNYEDVGKELAGLDQNPSPCVSDNCTLHRKQHQARGPAHHSLLPAAGPASSLGDSNSSSSPSSHEPKEKRVHFDLETLHSYRLRTHTASVRGRPGMVGRPGLGLGGLGALGGLGGFSSSSSASAARAAEPVSASPRSLNIHANGGPVSVLSGSPGLALSPLGNRANQTCLWEGELQELQGKIETFRSQLRDALARRAEIQTSLERERERERGGLGRRETSLERERDKQRIQTVCSAHNAAAAAKPPEREQLQTLNNQQGAAGCRLGAASSQLNTVNSLDRGRPGLALSHTLNALTAAMAGRTVQSRASYSASLERGRANQPGGGGGGNAGERGRTVQSRNTASLDRQKANLAHTVNTLDRTRASQSNVSSGT